VNEVVKIPVQKFSIIKSDPRFIYCDFWFSLVGENYNGSIIEIDAYEYAKSTIEYLPICGKFRNGDFLEHEDTETPLGTILTLADNNYRYEYAENGLQYVRVLGIIYRDYCQKEANKILKDGIKKTSIELEIEEKTKLDNGKYRIDKFNYRCITILGNKYKEGMEGCHLEVIDNPKDKFAKFIEKVKFEFDSSNNLNNKINKKEDELMNKDEIASKFSLTAMQLYDVLYTELSKVKYIENWYGEAYECSKYWLRDFDSEYIYAYDCEKGIDVKIPYTMNGDNAVLNFEEAKRIKYTPVDWDEGMGEEIETEFAKSVENSKKEFAEKIYQCGSEKMSSEKDAEFSKEKEEMNTKFSDLSNQLEYKNNSILTMGAEIDNFKSEVSKFSEEIASLKTDILSKDESIATYVKKEKELLAEKIISQYANKLTEEEQKQFVAKVNDFDDMEKFKKELKAFVCDKYEDELKGKTSTSTFSYLGITIKDVNQPAKGTSWTDYINEYNK
jgi:hypothetical protein